MLDMDFTSKGITWVGNIYQKFETMCQDVYQEVDGIVIQDKTKYVESQVQTGCETVRKFCAEVMQDLLLPPDCTVKAPVSDSVKVPASDVSLNYNADVETCKKTETGFEKCPLNEKTLLTTDSEAVISPGSNLMQAQLNTNQKEANCREECGILSEKSAPASRNLKDTEGNHLDAVEVVSYISNFQNGCTSVLHPVSTSHQNVMDKRPKQSGHIPSTDAIGLLDDFDREKASENTDNVEASMETEEEYEDLKLEASSIYAEARDKTHLLTHQDRRKRSYKKKLRDALSLKPRFARKNDDRCQKATLSGEFKAGIEEKDLTASSSIFLVEFNAGIEEKDLMASSSTFLVDLDSRKSIKEDSYESEWELL